MKELVQQYVDLDVTSILKEWIDKLFKSWDDLNGVELVNKQLLCAPQFYREIERQLKKLFELQKDSPFVEVGFAANDQGFWLQDRIPDNFAVKVESQFMPIEKTSNSVSIGMHSHPPSGNNKYVSSITSFLPSPNDVITTRMFQQRYELIVWGHQGAGFYATQIIGNKITDSSIDQLQQRMGLTQRLNLAKELHAKGLLKFYRFLTMDYQKFTGNERMSGLYEMNVNEFESLVNLQIRANEIHAQAVYLQELTDHMRLSSQRYAVLVMRSIDKIKAFLLQSGADNVHKDHLSVGVSVDPVQGSHRLENDAAQAPGGIDLDPSQLDLSVQTNDSSGLRYAIDPKALEKYRSAPGFVPIVIETVPLIDLARFLEM